MTDNLLRDKIPTFDKKGDQQGANQVRECVAGFAGAVGDEGLVNLVADAVNEGKQNGERKNRP